MGLEFAFIGGIMSKLQPSAQSSASSDSTSPQLWWQKGIIYQIYPRSFADSNEDGVGDLNGIIRHLDYLQWLGVDALWLSPVYPSPMADFGYDISNYTDIDPLFGTLADFDKLVKEARARNLHLVMDFVPNHTSDQHPWFKESRSSRDSPRRDWYLWKDAKPDGSPPNNWLSMFGGSAWEWDEKTGQYYYHGFLKEQPDLNWRNPEVVKAMSDVLRFWLERGVDGFRVDVLWHIIKDDQWRDNPPNPSFDPATEPNYNSLEPVYSTDRPEVHEITMELRRVIESYGPDKFVIGEVYLPLEKLMAYYGPKADGAHMPYNFLLALIDWQSSTIMQAVGQYEALLPEGAWPNWVLGNHDKPRIASRIKPHQVRGAQLLLLTLRGTPTMYYGDELGMHDEAIAPTQVQDPFEKREPGKGNGRDPERTPMRWNQEPGAGFTSSETPWLPIGDNIEVNVASEKDDPDSILNMVQQLIAIRRKYPVLQSGSYDALPASPPVIAFTRTLQSESLHIVINLGDSVTLYPMGRVQAKCIFSTDSARDLDLVLMNELALAPGEGVILTIEGEPAD